MDIRLDQTVTFTVDWRDSQGHHVSAPADVTPYAGDSSVEVTDLGAGTYQLTPKAVESGVQAGVSAGSFNVVDSVNIAGGAATYGAIVWGTPTPA